MSEFDKEDQQVMDMVNGCAAPPQNENWHDCAPCDGEGYDNRPADEEIKCCDETCGMSRSALRQERRYHIRCRLKALWRLIIIELLGYAALGGVLVAGMVKGFVPMGAAVPAFVICFMWVAVRFDRWIRGGW